MPRRSRTAKALRIRAMPRNRSVPVGLAHGVVEAEMERDNITCTGAEDPWGREEKPLAQRHAEAGIVLDTEPRLPPV